MSIHAVIWTASPLIPSYGNSPAPCKFVIKANPRVQTKGVVIATYEHLLEPPTWKEVFLFRTSRVNARELRYR